MEGLFVYGTLRFPEVLRVLLGRVPDMRPATATGWSVRALPGKVYPGLVADPDGVARGLVMTDLTEDERRLLDAFEGDGYDPVLIPLDDGATRPGVRVEGVHRAPRVGCGAIRTRGAVRVRGRVPPVAPRLHVVNVIGNLRGDPRLQAGKESDPCGAGQGQAIGRQVNRPIEQANET
ncbi:hypothetical protein Acsp04_64200 [Actinomadura sp. NBRC 104425]|uniref:gamma-glutamylcyclotransferase family protein n=1 Tax=Actinomadura sp. NBRC 104425 TaxID=3032204 RepID=UPI0024A58319|nr:hypothetical protein Acsp04_64200 [Actinomadura sp. NBRC 104425]